MHNCGGDDPLDNSWAELSGKLRDAKNVKGNSGIGQGTAADADLLGDAWVGEGATVNDEGIWVSKDKLRQYRPPSWKPRLGKFQANFEYRTEGVKQWLNDAHLDITDLFP